jgi:hypothetical protein
MEVHSYFRPVHLSYLHLKLPFGHHRQAKKNNLKKIKSEVQTHIDINKNKTYRPAQEENIGEGHNGT